MEAHRPVLRVDPWLIVAAIGFVAAVGGAAYPAFRNDPLSAPGLILIVSWNEWYEASEIEPSQEHGRRELETTAEMSRRFRR